MRTDGASLVAGVLPSFVLERRDRQAIRLRETFTVVLVDLDPNAAIEGSVVALTMRLKARGFVVSSRVALSFV